MNKLREDAKKQSASVYLTLVSIIQSFALGFLLSGIKDAFGNSATHLWPLSQDSLITWLQIAAIFQAAVLCWHVNINNAIIMQRLVGLSDSYIPFVFAIPQFLMIYAIYPRNLALWFFGMAGYSLVSFWAFVMMYIHDHREPENADSFRILGWFPHFNRLYTFSAFPLFVWVGIHFTHHSFVGVTAISWLVFNNLVFITFTIVHCHIWNRLTAP